MPAQGGGGGGKPAKSEPEQQPVGWWPSWLPPYIPGGGAPPDPQPEPEPEESTQTYTSPHEFADKRITSAQYERYREEIREGKRDHVKQQSPAQNSEPPGASVLQDIEWSRDIEASEPLGLMFGGKGTTDIVVMANMLHAGIGEMKSILASGDTFLDPDDPTSADWGMIHNAAGFIEMEPKMLTGTRNLGPDLTLLLFVGSLFFEPLDWELTAADVAEALEEGDVGGAVLNAFLGLMPFVSSKTDDFIRYGADIVGGAGRAEVDNVLRGIDEGSDAGRALARVAATADDLAVEFNRFDHTSTDEAFNRLRNKQRYQHLTDAQIRSKAVANANISNSKKLRQQMLWAVKVKRYEWEWRVPQKGQDAHHIVPSGDVDAERARRHVENLGVSANSAYNGVGLD